MKRITMYTTPGCPYCRHAKDYFKQQDIPYSEVDVSKDEKLAQEMFNKSGQMGVPQIWIDNKLIIGFDKTKINQELSIT